MYFLMSLRDYQCRQLGLSLLLVGFCLLTMLGFIFRSIHIIRVIQTVSNLTKSLLGDVMLEEGDIALVNINLRK